MGPYSYGQALATDPAGCVRAPYNEWYANQKTCYAGLAPTDECNPRYVNGVWDYYHPFARDSKACGGILPPDILPQILDANAEVQGNLGTDVLSTLLKLNMDGNIGELLLTRIDPATNAPRTYSTKFTQMDMITDELFSPLLYRYSKMSPEMGEKVTMDINTSNGYVTLLFEAPEGGPGVLQYVMTNIPPIMPQSAAAQAISRMNAAVHPRVNRGFYA
jgi:hypothetical protein